MVISFEPHALASFTLVEDAPPVTLKWILLAGLAVGVLRFVWGFICWVVLKHHTDDWRPVDDGGGIEAALEKAALRPGWFYNVPHPASFEGGYQGKEFAERMKREPIAYVVPMAVGATMSGAVFLKGFVLNVFEGFALALLACLFWSSSAIPIGSLAETAGAAGAVGLLVSLTGNFANSIWMAIPWRHTWGSTFDVVVGYALSGALLWWLANAFDLLA